MKWETVELGSVAEVFNGKTPSKAEKRNEGSPVLKIKDVDELGNFRGFESFVEPALHQKYSKKSVRAGDTLVLNAAHSATHVGSKICRAPEEAIGALATGEWLMVRCNAETDPRFVNHWMTSELARRQIRDAIKGIHLYPKDVARFSIPLPPHEEQRRVAGILDAADALRRRRREALALLDTLPGAIFAEMFGDNPDSAGDWPTKKFGDLVADNLIGLVRGAKEISPELPVPYLKMDSITRAGRIDLDKLVAIEASAEEIEKYSVAPGDLLFNTRNTKELVGKSAVYHGPKGVVINNNVMRIRTTRETSPDFISGYLRSPFGYRQLEQRKSGTTSVFAVYAKSLMTLPVPVPPRDLIDEYDDRCRRMRDMRDHHVAHEFELKTLFASLQSRAFAGAL